MGVNTWVEGRDGVGCPTALREWLAEGSTMTCFELMHQACLGIPFSSSSSCFSLQVEDVLSRRLLLALLSSLEQGGGFPSLLPLRHWMDELEGTMGTLVIVIYSSLDWMPLPRP